MATGVVLVLMGAACTTGSGGTIQPGTTQPPADPASVSTSPGGDGTTTSVVPDDSGRATGATVCWASSPAEGDAGIAWEDVTGDYGLIAPLTGMHAHASAWGDVDGNGYLDLMVGTFADRRPEVYAVRGATGPSPDRLLLAGGGAFTPDETFPDVYGRASGAAFADLDLDGDLDLIVSRNGAAAPSHVYENKDGTFVIRTDLGLPAGFGGRSVAVFHLDGDRLVDLLITEDRYTGASSRLFRNAGDFQFVPVGTSDGWPDDVHGLGVATGDLNADGFTDVFVSGSNRLFLGTGSSLREVDARVTAWEPVGNEDDVAGSAIGDVNGDGLPDLLIGQHFNSTLGRGGPQPVRLFLNRTATAGADPVFEEVTEAAGLTPLPTKAPHVEFADIDNDGLMDIVTSASAEDGRVPAVFRNQGVDDGVPRFATPPGLGSAQYWVTAPSADVDRDGRLDILAVEWEPSLPTILFGNRSASGNWLEVSYPAAAGGGPGTRIWAYVAGAAGDPAGLVGYGEIVAAQGYAAGAVDAVHFGLGDTSAVDLVVTPPIGGEKITISGVQANQRIELPGGCS